MSKNKSPQIRINFFLPVIQHEKLNQLSEKTGYSISALLRRGIDILFKSYE